MHPDDLWAMLWGDERHRHEVRFVYDDARAVTWIPCHHKGRFVRLLDTEACFVSCVPRLRAHDDLSWDHAHILWASLYRADSCVKLQRFRPAPTAVWRSGRSAARWAVWALSSPLAPRWVQQATERLAHHLGGRRRDASPQALMPSPFSGRWSVEFWQPELFTPRQIVGGLRDAPDPNRWKQAA